MLDLGAKATGLTALHEIGGRMDVAPSDAERRGIYRGLQRQLEDLLMQVHDPDGSDFFGTGIVPDHEVPVTALDLRDGVDRTLLEATRLLRAAVPAVPPPSDVQASGAAEGQ